MVAYPREKFLVSQKIHSLTFAAIALLGLPSFAFEVRTYQFADDGSRPFVYFARDIIDTQLSGTFDLVLDQAAGTAQLTNLQARIFNPAYAPPNQNIPLTASARTYFDNAPLSLRWPTNLGSLPGRFLAPDLLEFDGPNSGVFLAHTANSNFPYLGHTYGSGHIEGHDTALEVRLGSDTATITAVADNWIVNDSPIYYLLNAQATLVPEPSTIALAVLAFAALPIRRRNSVPHNRAYRAPTGRVDF
jgi:hypothetical protein